MKILGRSTSICTSLFLGIDEREAERKQRIGADRSIQDA